MKNAKRLFLVLLITLSLLLVACGTSTTDGPIDSGTDTQDLGQTKTERICYGYIANDKLDSILKTDMFAYDHDSLGECKYKKVNNENALQGTTQVRIIKSEGRERYDKVKEFCTSKNNMYLIQGIGDEAFGTGYMIIYFLKDGNTWFVNLYTGDESLVPEITIFNAELGEVNKQKYEDHVKAIVKELALAVANN